MRDRDVKRRALEWVNRRRREYGMPEIAEFPQGYPRIPDSCPLAVGLSGHGDRGTIRARVGWVFSHIGHSGNRDEIRNPKSVSLFVVRFDREEYPDLIAK